MKNTSLEIVSLLKEQEFIEYKIENLLYGSIEIRERCHKKYIFVHYRNNNRVVSKYAGEYSEYLLRLINDNSVQAKQMKSQLRKIKKALTELGFKDEKLNENVAKIVTYFKENEASILRNFLALDKTPLEEEKVKDVIDGNPVMDIPANLVMKIINLKHAEDFILSNFILSNTSSIDILFAVNKFIEEGIIFAAGSLRTTPYLTNGRYEAPEIPVESVVRKEMEALLAGNLDPIDAAIESLLYIMKHKLFLYGNKRTALIYVNYLLISRGIGILSIPFNEADTFKKLYIKYRDEKDDTIKSFIKEKGIIRL